MGGVEETECRVQPAQALSDTIHYSHAPPLSGFTNGHFSVREEQAPHQLSDTRDEKMLGPSRVSPYSHIPQKPGMSLIFKEIPINYVFARRGF